MRMAGIIEAVGGWRLAVSLSLCDCQCDPSGQSEIGVTHLSAAMLWDDTNR